MNWLPKDERLLLAGYFQMLGCGDATGLYREGELGDLFRGKSNVAEYGESDEPKEQDIEKLKAAIARLLADEKRVRAANRRLVERKLITLLPHSTERAVVEIGLTLEGYDLGRQYSSWLTRSHLWFREFKDHWICFAFSFLGGLLGAIVVQLLREAFRADGR